MSHSINFHFTKIDEQFWPAQLRLLISFLWGLAAVEELRSRGGT